jgi:hypothetical protein
VSTSALVSRVCRSHGRLTAKASVPAPGGIAARESVARLQPERVGFAEGVECDHGVAPYEAEEIFEGLGTARRAASGVDRQAQPIRPDARQRRRQRGEVGVTGFRFRDLGAFAGYGLGLVGSNGLETGSKPGVVGCRKVPVNGAENGSRKPKIRASRRDATLRTSGFQGRWLLAFQGRKPRLAPANPQPPSAKRT